jgi:hypothetical protein
VGVILKENMQVGELSTEAFKTILDFKMEEFKVMFNKNDMINVYNESSSPVYGLSTINDYGYKFEPANEYGEPSILPIPYVDVQYMNNRSEIFRTGGLRFEKELEDEIYKSLNVRPEYEKNYFTLDDIKDIILNPTVEKLERIKNVTSVLTIEKFRGVLVSLNNEDEYDIAQRVFDVINLRWDELSLGRIKSDIIIKKKKNEKAIDKTVDVSTIDEEESQPKTKNTRSKANK